MKYNAYAPALNLWWKLLKSNGVDPTATFLKHGLTFSDLKDEYYRLSVFRLINLLTSSPTSVFRTAAKAERKGIPVS